ncbi:hypothetical protein [Flagellimonas allohymeniacidonis]|uniref:Ligand-binding sensor domain-containing protein n=1 Tax=Flagellimonas allohymeniacidonis TaxID=2517819 RepID=A0A4Q8QD77_9FLAO|nr:hypothetical protein [Allomuricauda hymeniacidonis]TAI47644.1 hypothetical protein EW142_13350 [Allomuricauda hymeniacidonis]
MKKTTVHILIYFLLGVSLCTAQNFRYTYFNQPDFPFQKVAQVNQDGLGYIWIASDQGLFRFDGTQFEDFNLTLKSRNIKSILPIHKDTLLFSNDSGIFKLSYQGSSPKISSWVEANEGVNLMGYPEVLFKDSQNRIWVGQLDGSVFCLNESGRLHKRFVLSDQAKTEKISFEEDKFNTVWTLVPNEGLFYFDETKKQFISFGSHSKATHFSVEESDFVVVGDQVHSFSLNSTKQITRSKIIDSGNLEFNWVSKDLAGNCFLGSTDGLYALDEENTVLKKVFGSNDPHRVEELPFSSIDHLFFSHSQLRKGGDIWVSTSQGFGILQSPFFQSVSGLPHDNVLNINTQANAKVLIAMGSLFQLKKNDGAFDFDKKAEPSRVSSISAFNNFIWYGTVDGIIHCYQDNSEKQTIDLTQRGGGIFFMSADHVGDNWFCQAPLDKPILGVAKVTKDGGVVTYGEEKGLRTRILVIREGGRSEIYAAGIGQTSYLFKYNRENDVFEDKSLPFSFEVGSNFEVHDLTIDHQGVVWLATTDGLLKYDTEAISRVHLGPYTRNEIRSVVTTEDGSLWLATDTNGLLFYEKNGEFIQFDERSGTPSKVSTYRNLRIDPENLLWFGTAEGAVYSSKANARPLQTNAPLIKSIEVNEKEIETASNFNVNERSSVKIHLNTIAFPGNEVVYQYKIIDDALSNESLDYVPWSNLVDDTFIRLDGLKKGRYQLYLRGQQLGGHIWSEVKKLTLVVKPVWYATWWGILMLSAFTLLLLWGIARQWERFKTRSLRSLLLKEQTALAKKEKQLAKKDSDLKHQKEALKSTGANIYLLNRLLNSLLKSKSWPEVLTGLKKLVELPTGIDAFEIAQVSGREIKYQGFHRNKSEHIRRKIEFNEKENLPSYVLATNKPLIVDDFKKQAMNHIADVPDSPFSSHLLVPFQLDESPAVFCLYGIEEKRFSQRDLSLIQILTNFLGLMESKSMKNEG